MQTLWVNGWLPLLLLQGSELVTLIEMSFDRVSRRSEAFRRGEPASHRKAVSRVVQFIINNRAQILPPDFKLMDPFRVWFPPEYVKEKMIRWDRYEYDVGCLAGRLQEPVLIVEVGGPGDDSRHQYGNTAQLIKDGIAKEYIERYHPRCRFQRIPKGDAWFDDELRKRLFLP